MTQKIPKSRRHAPTITRRVSTRTTGFTLIELSVTLAIILMVVAMTLPTMMKLIDSRANMESFNLVAAQLSAARAEAVNDTTYAGVHLQLDTETDMAEKTAYSMVITIPPANLEDTNPVFKRHDLFMPRRLPGSTAMGKLTSEFITDANPSLYQNLSDANLESFCSFSIIFSPDGSVVTKVKGANIMFDSADPMFSGIQTKIWDHTVADNKPGIKAFTLFNYLELLKLEAAERATYLDENGQFLPVNMHTGQLFDWQ